MNLVIEFRWFRDYHGRTAADDRAPIEWPPSPWRLVCALLNAAKPQAVEGIPESLAWLASLPAPDILTPPAGDEIPEPRHIVPLNDLFPNEPWRDGPESRARLAKIRSDLRLPILGDKTIRYLWELKTPPPPDAVERLDKLMAMVPYLGIAEDSGAGSAKIMSGPETHFPESTRWLAGRDFGRSLPVVDPAALQNLVTFHHSGRRQIHRFGDIAPTFTRYQCESEPDGLFQVFRLEDSRGGLVSFDPSLICDLSEQTRGALLKALKTTGVSSDFLHGHHGKDRDHLQIIPLPSIGHEHADGRIRRLLLKGNPLAGEMRDVSLVLKELAYAPLAKSPTFLVPEYSRSGVVKSISGESADWVTTSPVILPNPELRGRDGEAWRNRSKLSPAELMRLQEKRKSGQQKIILRLLRDAGIEPLDLAVQSQSFKTTIPDASSFQITPSRVSYLKHTRCHVRLKLAKPMAGPLVLGPGRFFGLGLLVPARALQFESA